MEYQITAPFTKEKFKVLYAGDRVLLTGTLYTARDAAHKRMLALLDEGKPLPFSIENALLYYVGPTPQKPHCVIGAAGPTTSYRMDAYAPRLLTLGQAGMIGKGQRSQEVKEALVAQGAVYFAAIGGAGALLAQRIKAAKVIAFEDLGAEAIRRLEVEDFPVTVVIDSQGTDLYLQGQADYLKRRDGD